MLTIKKVVYIRCLLLILLSFNYLSSLAGLLDHLKVNNVAKPVIGLNGKWKFTNEPKGDFWKNTVSQSWNDIDVPGEVAMQGFSIRHDNPVAYYREISIPADFKSQRIILRFDGVYSYARLWINGSYVRDHHGGFTRWEADITSLVSPGKSASLVMEVTDKFDDISYAAGYAKHIIGGILRDVTLYAVPFNHLREFYVDADLDDDCKDGILRLSASAESSVPLEVRMTLRDQAGVQTGIEEKFQVSPGGQPVTHQMPVSRPNKWDSEHPYLYTIEILVFERGKKSYSFERKVGFRKITIEKNVFLVNGRPVKLRGACWHNIHPALGRLSTPDYELMDVKLAKEANMNFIRTSHYAPPERFVELCDQYGIFLEAETGGCFVNFNRPSLYGLGITENDTAYTRQYLEPLKEMVSTLRSNPSVIIWSIGNENRYGTNFQKCYDWLKAEDMSRPVIFSFPGTVPKDKKIYDLLSVHYPSFSGDINNQFGISIRNFSNPDMPVIFDEMAHTPCYVNETLREDPNIRSFWGQSLDKMFSNMFEIESAAGGAIWCMIDEVFMMPPSLDGFGRWWGVAYPKEHLPLEYRGPAVGYGEWGIIDIWRRKKPEFWATRKAYSPVRLLETTITQFIPGAPLYVPVHNRFDHTNLNEVTAEYTLNGITHTLTCPPVEPHQKGLITFGAHDWKSGDMMKVLFKHQGRVIDEYRLQISDKIISQDPAISDHGNLEVSDIGDTWIITGEKFILPVDLKTGLIRGATINNDTVIVSGPYLQVRSAETKTSAADWQVSSVSHTLKNNVAEVMVSGKYQDLDFSYLIRADAAGRMDIGCTLPGLQGSSVKEQGIFFIVTPAVEKISWERNGYFSEYPDVDLGALQGASPLYNSCKIVYGKEPPQNWAHDNLNFYYFGLAGADHANPLTNMAKGMKENVYSYALESDRWSVGVISPEASLGCRIHKDDNNRLIWYINQHWDYPETGWGNWTKGVQLKPEYQVYRFRLSNLAGK